MDKEEICYEKPYSELKQLWFQQHMTYLLFLKSLLSLL